MPASHYWPDPTFFPPGTVAQRPSGQTDLAKMCCHSHFLALRSLGSFYFLAFSLSLSLVALCSLTVNLVILSFIHNNQSWYAQHQLRASELKDPHMLNSALEALKEREGKKRERENDKTEMLFQPGHFFSATSYIKIGLVF